MRTTLLEGKILSHTIRKEMMIEMMPLKQLGIQPGLAVVLVGTDVASQIYVKRKYNLCVELGFYSEVHRLPAHTTEEQLLALVQQLNKNKAIHGILVQLPLPKHMDEKVIITAIAVEKDVDGFHPINMGNLVIGAQALLPCTPAGIIELLKRHQVDIVGKHAVVIGRSNIVGKPLSLLLQREHATVTMCHSQTRKIQTFTKQADILVVAVGQACLIDHTYVKPGAIIIDVGINRLSDGKLVGDVNFEAVQGICRSITPVPGGVGPMTTTMLMVNTLKATKQIRCIADG